VVKHVVEIQASTKPRCLIHCQASTLTILGGHQGTITHKMRVASERSGKRKATTSESDASTCGMQKGN
jgi:hypothetical protein